MDNFADSSGNRAVDPAQFYKGVAAATLTVISLYAAPAARADVIFTTFGPGSAFDQSTSYPVAGGGPFLKARAVAASFTPSADYRLDSADVAISNDAAPITVTFSIFADENGKPGGTRLIQQQINHALPSSPGLYSWSPPTIFFVGRNKTYWLVLDAGVSGAVDGRYLNNKGFKGVALTSNDGFEWIYNPNDATPAFAINGTPDLTADVPEPGVMAFEGVAAAGILGLVSGKRKRLA